MKLQKESIEWAINHLFKENDTDLFPRPIELDIIQDIVSFPYLGLFRSRENYSLSK